MAPFIAADEEGGRVVRASKYSQFRDLPFPAPRDLFAAGGYAAVETDTREKAAFLLDLGVNFNYVPVCDMSGNPDTFIYDRTFGNDPTATARYVDTVVRTMNACGLVGSIKHFPGYGDNVDTHTGIAHDDRSRETFLTRDLAPFRAGIAAGAPIVMVAHNIVSCMDPRLPRLLSPPVHSLLREELGFEGLIITDSLDMGAITQYTHDRASAVQAVLAGNDCSAVPPTSGRCPLYWMPSRTARSRLRALSSPSAACLKLRMGLTGSREPKRTGYRLVTYHPAVSCSRRHSPSSPVLLS